MKIAVLGAGARTGAHIVRHAHNRGDDVTAVVRNPEKFLAGWTGGVVPEVRTADAREVGALTTAFQGQDAVSFSLGASRGEPNTIHREAMAATLAAMRAAGIRRIVALSASGMVTRGDDPLSRYLAKPIVKRILAANFEDLLAMEALLAQSDVDWTVIRPPRLTDKPGTGHYRSRRDGNVRWHFVMNRDDLGLAMVDALHDDSSIGAHISVAS
ncbi:MAG: NAD(P)H-binding protein [Propionibacteriaceae bacterium]